MLSFPFCMQDQYPAHQIQAHVPQHGPRAEYKSVPFEGTTTNQDAYKAYAVAPHRAMHAPVVARPYTKFEGMQGFSGRVISGVANLSASLSNCALQLVYAAFLPANAYMLSALWAASALFSQPRSV